MVKLLVLASLFVGVPILWMNTMALLGWRRLRRRNEVLPAQPTRPPLRWLASPERGARLHRQLRDACHALREVVPPPRKRRQAPSSLEALAADLEAQAVALDRELVLSARLRGPTGAALQRAVAVRVSEVQRAVARLAALAAKSSRTVVTPSGPAPTTSATDPLHACTQQLDALDSAWAEIDRIEHAAGLRTAR
jgi:hypothetical protein